MQTSSLNGMTRRGVLRAFAATAVIAAPTYSRAFGFLKGAGDIRQLKMYSARTGEHLNMVYWIDGEYIPEALHEVNRFMRDWRTGGILPIAPQTLDILAASYNLLEPETPYLLLSGYRSAQTNAMLRRRSSQVAKHSLHIKGEAADVRLENRSVRQIASAALSCEAGGVGRYTKSNFVHMDCGPIRTWGR